METKTKKLFPLYIITCLITLAPLITGLIYWSEIGETVAIHFSLSGKPNGYANKTTAVFFFPLLLLVCQLVMIFSYTFSKKKDISLFVEVISYIFLPLCSILCAFVLLSSFTEIKMNLIFTLIFALIIVLAILVVIGSIKDKKNK